MRSLRPCGGSWGERPGVALASSLRRRFISVFRSSPEGTFLNQSMGGAGVSAAIAA